jgi:hypothetical protein
LREEKLVPLSSLLKLLQDKCKNDDHGVPANSVCVTDLTVDKNGLDISGMQAKIYCRVNSDEGVLPKDLTGFKDCLFRVNPSTPNP